MKKFMTQWTMLCVLVGLSATVQAATLAEAIDMPGATITTSGYGWEATPDRAQTGGYCARSKNYNVNSSTASMTLTVTGPGRISFRWMSSGEGRDYDYLWYCVDGGGELRRIQGDHGDSSWQTVTYDISGAGTHTITWTYRKDGSGHYGSDRGYVDCVTWMPKIGFHITPNSTPLANTYKLSWELAEGAREGQVKLDGNVLAATTNNVANYIWQPTTTGSHKFIYTSGGQAVTQTVNVTALSFPVAPTPNPPTGRDANIAITPATRDMPIGGGSRAITTSGSGTWSATASDSWITLKPTSGTAGTPVGYTVAASDAIGDRVGYVYVSGYVHAIKQSGYEADAAPSTFSADPAGLTGTVSVSMSGRYTWTAKPDCDWISLNKAGGTGDGTVTFTVAPYTEVNTRTGTMTIAGKTVTVTQTGRTMRISENAGSFDYYTHAVALTVDALASTDWRVTPNASWISVVTPASGVGRGGSSVGLAIGENPSYRGRTGTVTIGEQTYTVTQAGRPEERLSFDIAPKETTASVMGANGSIAVTATPDLPWRVASQANWLTIASGATGAGNGNIAYTVQPNSTLFERRGTITVTPEVGSAKTQTVTQPAAVSEISSDRYEFEPAGESCTVEVTVDANVEWTVAESISWISVSGGTTTRVGPATLTITASPNDSIDKRGPATVTIAGHPFVVSQRGRAVTIVDGNDNKVYGTESADGSIDIHPDGDVAWHAEASDSWIIIMSDESGTGDATIEYVLTDYLGDGKSRTGWITIGGTKVYITQRSYEFDINPKARTVDGNNGAGEIGISAPIGSIWDAVVTEPWITIVKDYDPATGNGTIHYSFTENDTGRNRTGRIIVNGEAYTLTQMKRLRVRTEGRGGVMIEGTYGEGQMMTLTATNAEDYVFSQWKRDGVAAGSTNPKQVAIEDIERMTAVFTPVAPTVTATAGATAVREGVTVSWTEPVWALNYNIYRATTTTKPSTPLANVTTGTTYSDTTAVPGTTYYYWVEAVGSQETAVSARVSGQRRVSLQTVTVSGSDALFSGMTATYTASSLLNSGAACTTGTKTWSVVGSAATIGSSSGVLTAKSASADTTVTVRLTHTYDGITVVGEKVVAIRPTVALSTLVGGGLSSVTTGGTKQWFGQKYDTCDGADAARSPALASGQNSWFSSSVTGPGTLTFKWRTTAAGERLAFGIGSDVTDRQEAVTPDWQTVTKAYRDDATRAFRWTYTAGANNGYALVGGIVWTPAPASVTVTFNHQDGETDSTTQAYVTGRAFGTLPTPVRAGYTFGGWFMEPSCVTRVNEADYAFIADTTVYAKWTAKEYTVVFHREGGSSSTVTRTGFLIDVAANLPDLTSDLDWGSAATFTGWSKTRGAAVATYGNGAEVKNLTTTIGDTVHLYGVWMGASQYRIVFSRNAGAGDTVTGGQVIDRGAAQRLAYKDSQLGGWSRPGYEFLGWNADERAKTAMFANGEQVKNISHKGGTVYLYAVWASSTPTTYTVRFNRNDGSGDRATRTFSVGKEAQLPWKDSGLKWANPSGKAFLGWGTSASATVVLFENGGTVKDIATPGATVDLYAIWRPTSNYYIVKFHRNTSVSDTIVASQWIARGKATGLAWKDSQLAWANPSGRAFLGWARTASATAKVWANGETVTDIAASGATIDLYAVWSGGAAKSSAQVKTVRQPQETGLAQQIQSAAPQLFESGYYRGIFEDPMGTFDLVLDDSPVSAEVEAYFAAQTEDGCWSDACEAEVVGETLVLTFEDRVIVVRMSDGTPIATYATGL